MSLPVFSSRNIKVNWLGKKLGGLAPDSSVVITPSSPTTETEVGADGEISISLLPDFTGTVTLSFQYNSPSNHYLSAVYNAQRASGTLYRGDLGIHDPSGGVAAVLRRAHIQSRPEVTIGSSAAGQTQNWTFFCEDMLYMSTLDGFDIPANILADIGSFKDAIEAFKL